MQNGLGDQFLQLGGEQQRQRTANQHHHNNDARVSFGAGIPLAHVRKQEQSSHTLAVHRHLLEDLKIAVLKAVAVLLRAGRK